MSDSKVVYKQVLETSDGSLVARYVYMHICDVPVAWCGWSSKVLPLLIYCNLTSLNLLTQCEFVECLFVEHKINACLESSVSFS